MRSYPIIVGCLLILMLLAGCTLTPGISPVSSSKLQLADQREIRIDRGVILSYSPDGRWLLVRKEQTNELCAYETASLTEQSCAALPHGSPDLPAIVWSPDSSRIALTENFPLYFEESDVWVLELESGKLTGVTDDGIDQGWSPFDQEHEKVSVDGPPAWSPDGASLVFARTDIIPADEDWDTDLYRVPAEGGAAEKLATLIEGQPHSAWYRLRVAPNGERVFYTLRGPKRADPSTGLWALDLDSAEPRQLLGLDEQLGVPLLMEIAADGRTGLVLYSGRAEFGPRKNISYYTLVDLESGNVTPLKQHVEGQPSFSSPYGAAFAPSGDKIAYTYRREGDTDTVVLAVRDLNSQEEHILAEISTAAPLGGGMDYGLGFDWAANDTLYVAAGRSEGMLLTLTAQE